MTIDFRSMKLAVVVLCVVQILAAAPLLASEVLPEGTWINMRFIDELKTSRSVAAAFGVLRPDELLVLRAVRQSDSVLLFYTSRGLDEGQPTDMRISTTKGLGDQRRITVFGQTWLLGIAKAQSEYIALHSTVDSTALPDVFAVIPSRNQNADFIYQRVLNSATLSGSYRDARGKVFTFNAMQQATTPKGSYRYRIVVVPDKPYQIIEVVSDNSKQRVRYAYAWSGETLTISTFTKNGSLKTLHKLKRK